jgi:hypothetical protein
LTFRNRMAYVALVALILLSPLFYDTAAAHGNQPWIDEITHAAAEQEGVSYWQVESILHCESVHYRASVIAGAEEGSSGEIGIAQILPSWTAAGRRYGSLGATFEARGGDYYSVSDEIYFLAWAIARGMRFHWHC